MKKLSTKSEICSIAKIEKEKAMKVAEDFAKSEGLSTKGSLHVRLISEELLGLIGVILDVDDGEFWLERNGDFIEAHLHARTPISPRAKGLLVSVSADRKNIAYSGMTGLLRNVFDGLTSQENLELHNWSYKKELQNKRLEKWDELERSVLVCLCDDITVSLRNKKADIVAKITVETVQ